MSALNQSLTISSLPPNQPLDSPSANSSAPSSPGYASDVSQPTTFNLGKRYRPTPLPTPSLEASAITPVFELDQPDLSAESTGVTSPSTDEASTTPTAPGLLRKVLIRRSTGKGFRLEDNPDAPPSPPSTADTSTPSNASSTTSPKESEHTEARKKIVSSKEKHREQAAAAENENEVIVPPSLSQIEEPPASHRSDSASTASSLAGPSTPVDSEAAELSSADSSGTSTAVPSPGLLSPVTEGAVTARSEEDGQLLRETDYNGFSAQAGGHDALGTPDEEKPLKNYKREMQAHTKKMIRDFSSLNMAK